MFRLAESYFRKFDLNSGTVIGAANATPITNVRKTGSAYRRITLRNQL